MPLSADQKCPDRVNPIVVLDLDEFNQEVFDSLSDKMKATVMQSREYKAMFGNKPDSSAEAPPADFDDDIPW